MPAVIVLCGTYTVIVTVVDNVPPPPSPPFLIILLSSPLPLLATRQCCVRKETSGWQRGQSSVGGWRCVWARYGAQSVMTTGTRTTPQWSVVSSASLYLVRLQLSSPFLTIITSPSILCALLPVGHTMSYVHTHTLVFRLGEDTTAALILQH